MSRAFFCLLLLFGLALPGQSAPGGVSAGAPLPALALRDSAGHRHGPAEWQGRPVALLFFCGCAPCHAFARLWAQAQEGGDLGSKTPSTVVVFSGSPAAAEAFARDTGLDPAQTLLLTDPDDSAGRAYGVRQCPRVFVADPRGRLAYTNPDGGSGPAAAGVSRALTAWRKASPAPPPPETSARVQFLPGLAFLPVPGSSASAPGTLHYDGGSVDVTRAERWTRTFTLRNTGRQAATAAELRGSCGCETLLLTKGGLPARQVRLAPGETAEVRVDVRLSADEAGLARKYVWVYGPQSPPGQSVPLATLELDLALRQSAAFSPSRLDFGRVPSGTGGAQTVTVTLDADLAPSGMPPPLVSLDPAVRAVPTGPPQAQMVGGRAVVIQRYRAALSPAAPAGRVSAVLRFGPPPDGTAPKVWARPALPVSAVVAGDLDALPATVFFGSLPAGTSAVRTVVLSLAAAQTAASLTVTSPVPWLQARIEPSSAPATHQLLSVTLAANAPPGLLQAELMVVSGRSHLEIPVVAERTK